MIDSDCLIGWTSRSEIRDLPGTVDVDIRRTN